ncbi:transporter substrate-binding domain-containing protein [Pseudodesulfovibrio cashew]|uniref:Transporter substrate-binding domain-containing protein n=1 Tax=Pseudodesulfovibrio cashew TaxID=2678688 RepID=A0A6I6JEE1_9BACT|nr:transporter substrate-binding domain-containing protein [Pseudodesulfovibrio cashew]QGY39430.1 transporter substrate-binding domain-containing protein [Pseudodesulfovibrio cashew]
MKQTLILFLAALLALVLFNTASAQSLENTVFLTEDLRPFNFKADGQAQGVAVDALLAALKVVGVNKSTSDITFYPWSRAYYLAKDRANTCLFSTCRLPQRESLFKWAGPIMEFSMVVITRKGGRPVRSLDDLKHRTVGVLRDGAGHQMLQTLEKQPITVELSTNAVNLMKRLAYGRTTAVLTGEQGAYLAIEQAKLNRGDFETDLVVSKSQIYYAFNPATQDAVVQRLQRGIDAIRADGTLERIIRRYLK